jgi:hypothetical protein
MAEQRTTNASGAPVASNEHSLTVGPNGPTALQDAYVVQKMQHFNRERVPERVVHAKGQRRYERPRLSKDYLRGEPDAGASACTARASTPTTTSNCSWAERRST